MTRILDRARALWTALAGAPVAFPGPGRLAAVLSPGSRLCPPGWAGFVVVGGAGIATVPTPSWLDAVSPLPADLAVVRSSLPAAEALGPATLSYLDPAEFRPVHDGSVEAATATATAPLLAAAGEGEAGESGLAEIQSPAFILRSGDTVLAAAGYRRWLETAAHLCVLTHPDHRNAGLARMVASAATAHALDAGLLAQWRARPAASRRVAAALGFRESGAQLSLRPREPDAAAAPP